MLKETSLKNLYTTSKTVHNAIISLGDIDDSGKGKKFKSRFIQPGLAGYPGQFGTVLVKKETLDDSIKTIVGAPVIINHKDITEDNADNERVGVISNVWYNEADGWYWCDGIIWDETAQNLITDKGWSVSCSYDFLEENDEGGIENNIPYDREFTKLNFVHLALVDNPRYERANIVFNSKTNTDFTPNVKEHETMNIKNWNEQDHPRDEQGKFTNKGGSSTSLKQKWVEDLKNTELSTLIEDYGEEDEFIQMKIKEFEDEYQKIEDYIKIVLETEKKTGKSKEQYFKDLYAYEMRGGTDFKARGAQRYAKLKLDLYKELSKNKVNNNKDRIYNSNHFKSQFIEVFCQALTEVIAENSLGE